VIRKNLNKFASICLGYCLLTNVLSAQTISPFNKRIIVDTLTDYSFIVSGHFHGASSSMSTFPAATLLANIDTLNGIHPLFLMSLGDLFLKVDTNAINHYQKSLFAKLQTPFFNAVGNHDVSGNSDYEKLYGRTFYYFKVASELFVVLNTELNDGSIKNEQLALFKNAINLAATDSIKNVFIFSHRPVWAESLKKYERLFTDNTRTLVGRNNFSEEIKPLLQSISTNKRVYWISGSMGDASSSFFYDKDDESNVTYIQTAIRDLPRDAVLQVNIKKGNISFNGISFTGQSLQAIEEYNMDYWLKPAPKPKINWRLIPYTIWVMICYQDFWIGFTLGVLLLLMILFFRKRWKKGK
jgi:hypothetical protein